MCAGGVEEEKRKEILCVEVLGRYANVQHYGCGEREESLEKTECCTAHTYHSTQHIKRVFRLEENTTFHLKSITQTGDALVGERWLLKLVKKTTIPLMLDHCICNTHASSLCLTG